MRFFELFDLPVNFQLDEQLLVERYREIQKRVHPDHHANASENEKLLSVQAASEVNDAFQTLKNH